jgi:kinesin family protein C1
MDSENIAPGSPGGKNTQVRRNGLQKPAAVDRKRFGFEEPKKKKAKSIADTRQISKTPSRRSQRNTRKSEQMPPPGLDEPEEKPQSENVSESLLQSPVSEAPTKGAISRLMYGSPRTPAMSTPGSPRSHLRGGVGTPATPAKPSQSLAFFQTIFSYNKENLDDEVKPQKSKVKSKHDFKAKFNEAADRVKHLKGLVRTLRDETQEYKNKVASIEKDLQTEVRSKTKLLRAKEKDLKATHLKLEGQRTTLEKQKLGLAEMKMAKEQLEKEAKAVAIEKEKVAKELAKVNREKSENEQMATELRVKLGAVEQELKDVREKQQISDTAFHQLQLEKATELEAVQKEWQAKLDKEIASTIVELEETKHKMSEQTGELKANSKGKDEMSEKLQALQRLTHELQTDKKAADNEAARQSEETARLQQRVTELTAKLDSKGDEVTGAIASFQKVSADKEARMQILIEEKTELKVRCEGLMKEKETVEKSFRVHERAAEDNGRELGQLQEKYDSLAPQLEEIQQAKAFAEAKLVEAEMKLAVEVQCRERLELREDAKEKESIAISAQLLAVQGQVEQVERDKASMLEQARTQWELEKMKLEEAKREAEEACHTLREREVALESEVRTIRETMEERDNSTNQRVDAEQLQKLCNISSEADVLRNRLMELETLRKTEQEESKADLAALEERVQQGEVQRRKMHNQISDLKGNVRVFVRARPFLPSDGLGDAPATGVVKATVEPKQDGASLQLVNRAAKDAKEAFDETREQFTFDKVFPPTAGQDDVFKEVGELVQSSLDGYNVCLFSYGQTGSGKTHTMQGSGTGQMRGVIPRSMEHVFSYANELGKQGWTYTMEVSFLEIYNETIRDLLHNAGEEKTDNSDTKYELKRDANGEMIVSNMSRIKVELNDMDQVEKLMEVAAKTRSTSKTSMNAQSSRSHSVFALYLTAQNKEQHSKLKGTLNLVDLAGSERLNKSKVEGARLKETLAINKSLSCLTDVFVAISNKNSHIPYRNSKLTHLLQPALSGDGKTLMMVNISPTPDSYPETLCSLRFARQVNQCELGKPKRQFKCVNSTPQSKVGSNNAPSSAAKANATPVVLAAAVRLKRRAGEAKMGASSSSSKISRARTSK